MHPLPFPYRADLVDNGGDVVVEAMPLAWWPADGAKGRAGLDYDHTGEVPLKHWEAVYPHVGSGYFLLENGMKLRISSASEQVFLPHVTLRLVRVQPPVVG